MSGIWLTKPETARRIRQRIGVVFDWAKAAGYRAGDNPVDGVMKGLPRQPDREEHFSAIAFSAVPNFLARLHEQPASEGVRLGLELLILTATRTSEVLGANWKEIDLESRIWTISRDRMKAGREHRVPLSRRAGEIIGRAKELAGGSEYVFPGRSPDKPMSNMAFLMLLRRMAADFTVHGFRSAFRDWASCLSISQLNLVNAQPDMVVTQGLPSAAHAEGRKLEPQKSMMYVKF